MGTIQQVMDFLKGKKSYILGAIFVIEGLMTGNWNRVLEGLSVISLRAGIAKN